MKKYLLITVLLLSVSMTACQPQEVVVTEVPTLVPTEVVVATQAPTPTSVPTQEPSAVLVNGEAITVGEVQAASGRYQLAQTEVGEFLTVENVQQAVIDELTIQLVMGQKAREAGFVLTEEELDARITAAVESAGGQDAFNAWMAANYFTADSFRKALRREIEAAWMRDQIVASVPTSQEQVLAREIFFLNEFDAQRVYNQLMEGSTFDSRVVNYDPQGLGYLGWFPRGVMFDEGLEDAIFALQPGQFSSVITTEDGFHIAEVIERDDNREVPHDLLLIIQEKVLEEWLAETLKMSTIDVLI